MNYVLIGYRGSGKSSIAKRIASKLWMDFVDTDTLITERAGKNIKEIFEAEGEAGFRRLECAVIAEVAGKDNQVIAAGGGAILNPDNVAALQAAAHKDGGKVVWLKATPETLYQRIAADSQTSATRPNLTTAGGLEEVKQLLEARMPLYQAVADLSYDVTYLTIDDAATRLLSLL